MMPELTGNWIGYVADLERLAIQCRPRRVLELGSGYFHAARVMADAGATDYVGVDRNVRRDDLATLKREHPTLTVRMIRSDIHAPGLAARIAGTYDCVLLDAHEGDAAQWGRDTLRQCALALALTPPLIVVDDCVVPEVADAAIAALGNPTGRGEGATGMWWWTR